MYELEVFIRDIQIVMLVVTGFLNTGLNYRQVIQNTQITLSLEMSNTFVFQPCMSS